MWRKSKRSTFFQGQFLGLGVEKEWHLRIQFNWNRKKYSLFTRRLCIVSIFDFFSLDCDYGKTLLRRSPWWHSSRWRELWTLRWVSTFSDVQWSLCFPLPKRTLYCYVWKVWFWTWLLWWIRRDKYRMRQIQQVTCERAFFFFMVIGGRYVIESQLSQFCARIKSVHSTLLIWKDDSYCWCVFFVHGLEKVGKHLNPWSCDYYRVQMTIHRRLCKLRGTRESRGVRIRSSNSHIRQHFEEYSCLLFPVGNSACVNVLSF